MRPQKFPFLDYGKYYQEIIKSKHTSPRRRLKHSEALVKSRVDSVAPALEKLQSIGTLSWKSLTSKALKNCYESSTKALGKLKDDIIADLQKQGSVNVEKCPYCMLQPPSTWDHYFPQAHYPELSIYHGNLLYVCSDCNREKKDHYSSAQLEFIHPYFYGDSSQVILFCKANIRSGKLSFKFYSGSTESSLKELAEIGQRHIDNLKLETDFQIESATVVSDFIAAIKEDFANGITLEQLVRLIEKNYNLVEESLGPNAWEARLWHALRWCPEFHVYANEQLPRLPNRKREGLEQAAPLAS